MAEENTDKVTLSDWLKAINQKTDLNLTEDNEKYYNSFIINRALSFHRDTVLVADEVNRMKHITKEMAFDFYKFFIPKKNRFAKWTKEDKGSEKDLKIMEFFGVSLEKARGYVKMIDSQKNAKKYWENLYSRLEKGGLTK